MVTESKDANTAAHYRIGVNMRFAEFKTTLLESADSGYYTIGDSHAVAVAQAGGKRWTNLAIGGRSSTDREMLGNINKVPSGAVVLVSQGANDTANAMRAMMDSGGKRPLKDPKQIAASVANVVNLVKEQGAKVIFLLFPNGPGRGEGLAKYYGGDYQEDVRKAIKSAISVPIIDLNGRPLTDGVHATMSVYRDVANQVVSGNTPTSGQGAKQSKDNNDSESKDKITQLEVPSGRTGPAVADIQKVLVALGYPLPKHGVDGVRGSETSAAVKSFQQDAGLTVDGDPGPDTVGALNKVMKQKGITITKSTQADVKGNVYGTKDIDDEDVKKLDPLPDSRDSRAARESAEKYLGRNMSDDEWNYLLRATAAESSFNKEEYAMVMGSILNRARDYGKNGVIAALMAPNQFQAVTGTAVDGHKPSANFVRGPSNNQMKMMLYAAVNILPRVSHSQRNFTAANPAAYGAGTNIGYLHRMVAQGGTKIGGTVFNTALATA